MAHPLGKQEILVGDERILTPVKADDVRLDIIVAEECPYCGVPVENDVIHFHWLGTLEDGIPVGGSAYIRNVGTKNAFEIVTLNEKRQVPISDGYS